MRDRDGSALGISKKRSPCPPPTRYNQGRPVPYLLATTQSQLNGKQGGGTRNLGPKESALPLDFLLYKIDISLQSMPGETRVSVTCSHETTNQHRVAESGGEGEGSKEGGPAQR